MKAVIAGRYGAPEVLKLQEIATPEPQADEVLIRIHATTVTSGDCRVRSARTPLGFGLMMRLVFGIFKPRQPVLGSELAGVIESVGKDVRKFKAGDQVIAFCGVSMGCHAEYKCMPENGAVVLKPACLDFGEAAALCFGGTTALDFLRRAKLRSGEKVLVIGASGAVGTAAVQLARYFGTDVTGVCSTANVELVSSLGANHVIDYTREDFTQNGETYDVIVDTVGNSSFAQCKASLKEGGRLLLLVASLPEMLRIPWVALASSQRIIAGPAAERTEDVCFLVKLAEAGEFKPVIGRRYPFRQIAEAHRHADTGHKRGNMVITL